MAVTLPAVVKNRIAVPDGKCVILNAIRFPDMSDFLIENFGKAGLDVQCETIECEQVSNMTMGSVSGKEAGMHKQASKQKENLKAIRRHQN